MPVTQVSRIRIQEQGTADLEFVTIDDTDGGVVSNSDGRTVLLLKNDDDTDPGTFKVEAQVSTLNDQGFGVLSKQDVEVTLAAGETKMIGPFATKAFNTGGNLVLSRAGDGDIECVALFY